MLKFCIIRLWFMLFYLLTSISHSQYILARSRPMSEALQIAIERTKQFQSTDRDRLIKPIFTQRAIKSKSIQPSRLQKLDVAKLNRLIKIIDKAWIMPEPGTIEPVGSNFQYKKTCASIYNARTSACEQLGFGIMCFNFCYEQGETLEFKCEDTSDSNFCQTHSNYDNFLIKYKKDTYRGKAYIHQQLTRCYSTSVCSGTLLNSSLIKTTDNFADSTKPVRALRNKNTNKNRNNNNRQRTTIGTRNERNKGKINSEFFDKRWHSALTRHPDRQATSGRTSTENGSENSEKYVPFWQRLLVRKRLMDKQASVNALRSQYAIEVVSHEDNVEEEEEQWLKRRFGTRIGNANKISTDGTREMVDTDRRQLVMKTEYNRNLILDKNQLPFSMEPVGFWNKFQPEKWFQSIHYITNTG